MAYRVDLTVRATRDLRRLYRQIDGGGSATATSWFNGLQAAILSLGERPARCPTIPEREDLRHLLYGSHRYRVIFRIDDTEQRVVVLHIRHGARKPMT